MSKRKKIVFKLTVFHGGGLQPGGRREGRGEKILLQDFRI